MKTVSENTSENHPMGKNDETVFGYSHCTPVQSQSLQRKSFLKKIIKLSMPQFPNLQYWDSYKKLTSQRYCENQMR